jgi:hypothetical protein
LSASFALMANPKSRAQYDALRAELIRYLERLDIRSEASSSHELRPELVPSPAASPDEVSEFAEALAATAHDLEKA